MAVDKATSDRVITTLASAGFSGEALRTAWAIVMRESGGKATAYNPDRATGDDSRGLFQINMLGQMGADRDAWFKRDVEGYTGPTSLFDPAINARAAYVLSKKGTNWFHWDIDKSGYDHGSHAPAFQKWYKQWPGDAGVQAPSGDQDTLDVGELASDFGQSYGVGLIMAHPELMVLAYQSQGWENAKYNEKTGKYVLGAKTTKEWDSVRTAAAIQLTQWYNSKDGNQRLAENAQRTDPTSYENRIMNLVANIEEKAVTAGADLSGVDVKAFASQILTENWGSLSGSVEQQVPDRLLNGYLAPYLKPDTTTGGFKGEAAVTAATLRQKADAYGVTLSNEWYLNAIQQMKAGKTTAADLDTEIMNHSKSRYVGLSGMINEQRSIKDIADPYIQMKADVLEMPLSQLTLADPDVQSALQVLDPKTGQTRSKSLWEFRQELRQKPEWRNTTQGRQELNAGTMKMLRDFGFVK